MKQRKITFEQMLQYVKEMDADYQKLILAREKLLAEIKGIQDRREILSWDEIASAVAYPKTLPGTERISGEAPDDFKLLHQAERINTIYRSQMEELFASLENIEVQIMKYQYVNRCINLLAPKDKEIIELFTRKNLHFTKGAEIFHVVRSTLYRMQKKAVNNLTEIYNANLTDC